MTELNLRKLKARDVRKMAALMGRHLPRLDMTPQPGQDEEEHKRKIGMSLISIVLQEELTEMWSWLADLNQMTAEELDEADVDLPLVILQGLYEGGQFQSFLGQASSLYSSRGKKAT